MQINTDPMKTISARLPEEDVELFQLVCEEYQLNQSEAIRYLIQSAIGQIFDAEDQGLLKEQNLKERNRKEQNLKEQIPGQSKEVQDLNMYQKQKEQDKFYESFKLLNQKQQNRPKLRISSL